MTWKTSPPNKCAKTSARPWKNTKIFYGGKRRKVRYKELAQVYWQRGAGQRPAPPVGRRAHPLSQKQEQ